MDSGGGVLQRHKQHQKHQRKKREKNEIIKTYREGRRQTGPCSTRLPQSTSSLRPSGLSTPLLLLYKLYQVIQFIARPWTACPSTTVANTRNTSSNTEPRRPQRLDRGGLNCVHPPHTTNQHGWGGFESDVKSKSPLMQAAEGSELLAHCVPVASSNSSSSAPVKALSACRFAVCCTYVGAYEPTRDRVE